MADERKHVRLTTAMLFLGGLLVAGWLCRPGEAVASAEPTAVRANPPSPTPGRHRTGADGSNIETWVEAGLTVERIVRTHSTVAHEPSRPTMWSDALPWFRWDEGERVLGGTSAFELAISLPVPRAVGLARLRAAGAPELCIEAVKAAGSIGCWHRVNPYLSVTLGRGGDRFEQARGYAPAGPGPRSVSFVNGREADVVTAWFEPGPRPPGW